MIKKTVKMYFLKKHSLWLIKARTKMDHFHISCIPSNSEHRQQGAVKRSRSLTDPRFPQITIINKSFKF